MSGSLPQSQLNDYVCPSGNDIQDEVALEQAMTKKGDAATLAEGGEFAGAIELMTEALAVKPSSAMWWAFRADLYLKNQQWDHAAADASQSLERNPDSARALRVRGMAHKQKGEWELAVKDLSASQIIDFNDSVAGALKEIEPKVKEIREDRLKKERNQAEEKQKELQALREKEREKEEVRKRATEPRLPVTLYDCITTIHHERVQGSVVGEGHLLFPGAPKWMSMLPEFLRVMHHEYPEMKKVTMEDLELIAAHTLKQRADDLRCRATEGMEGKCHHCEAIFKDVLPITQNHYEDEPPECGCGEVYCSKACHVADWPGHERVCTQLVQNQAFTEIYWTCVLKGYWTYPGDRDFVAEWETAKKRYSNNSDPKAEFCYYLRENREYYASRMGRVQTARVTQALRGQLDDDPEEKYRVLAPWIEEANFQMIRMTSPLLGDSGPRLAYKLTGCDAYHRMQESQCPVPCPSREEIRARFIPLIKKKKCLDILAKDLRILGPDKRSPAQIHAAKMEGERFWKEQNKARRNPVCKMKVGGKGTVATDSGENDID